MDRKHFSFAFTVILSTSLLLAGGCEPSEPEQTESQATTHVPIWNQPIPAGTELLPDGAGKIGVTVRRRTNGQQNLIEFELSEEHGYMVDGINIEFWYRFKDTDTGEWVDDTKKIGFFVKDRLPFNETIVLATALLPIEFKHLGADLAASTGENWGARVVDYHRAMKNVD